MQKIERLVREIDPVAGEHDIARDRNVGCVQLKDEAGVNDGPVFDVQSVRDRVEVCLDARVILVHLNVGDHARCGGRLEASVYSIPASAWRKLRRSRSSRACVPRVSRVRNRADAQRLHWLSRLGRTSEARRKLGEVVHVRLAHAALRHPSIEPRESLL